MKKAIYILACIAAVILGMVVYILLRVYTYAGNINSIFHDKITGCDKIVVRDGGYDPFVPYYSQKAIKIIIDPCDVNTFIKTIKFSRLQRIGRCDCYGYPGIDFYRNNKRILVTSIKHNIALCMPFINYDVKFTKRTRNFIENFVGQLVIDTNNLE